VGNLIDDHAGDDGYVQEWQTEVVHHGLLSMTFGMSIRARSDLMFLCIFEKFADIVASDDASLHTDYMYQGKLGIRQNQEVNRTGTISRIPMFQKSQDPKDENEWCEADVGDRSNCARHPGFLSLAQAPPESSGIWTTSGLRRADSAVLVSASTFSLIQLESVVGSQPTQA